MEVAQFNELIEEQIEDIRTRSGSKNAEYARGGDKLYNFRRAAMVMGCTAERALWGMFMKHFVSIQDIVEDVERDPHKYPTRELLDEKIGDAIVYLILLKTVLIDEGHVELTFIEREMAVVANKMMTEAVIEQYKSDGAPERQKGHDEGCTLPDTETRVRMAKHDEIRKMVDEGLYGVTKEDT